MSAVAYRKTQRATVMLALVAAAIVGVAVAATLASPWFWLVGLVLVAVAYMFSSLTVLVDNNSVQWYFGPGAFRKSVLLADIADVQSVRNKWWYGWGIRYTPHGWLYNASGLDAVQLGLAGGKTVRVGTDEPVRLCRVAGIDLGADNIR